MKKVIEGIFLLNAQDPYEPTGINWLDSDDKEHRLAKVLEDEFGLIPDCEFILKNSKKLKITIEEI